MRFEMDTNRAFLSGIFKHTDFKKSYRSGTVNSKSFISKVLLRIKWKFELN